MEVISTKLKQIVDPNNECCCEHSLAHKCKERAFNNGYEIESLYAEMIYQSNNEADGEEPTFKSKKEALVRIKKNSIGNGTVLKHYYAPTEPEAIFKAYQWLLDNKIN